jgi:hypothetical protein
MSLSRLGLPTGQFGQPFSNQSRHLTIDCLEPFKPSRLARSLRRPDSGRQVSRWPAGRLARVVLDIPHGWHRLLQLLKWFPASCQIGKWAGAAQAAKADALAWRVRLGGPKSLISRKKLS